MADFLVYSMIEWHYRWQRPQQIPTALSGRGHRVFYISNSIGLNQLDRPYSLHHDQAHDVFLVNLDTPTAPPNPYVGLLTDQQATWLARGIQELVDDLNLIDPVAIVQHPFWAPVLERLPGQYAIYDCMDHHAGFGDDAPYLHELESRMIERADHAVATSKWIAERINHPRISRIPNAVDLEHFIEVEPGSHKSSRPVVGYYGAIAHWFDYEFMRELALLMPEVDFVLAGEVSCEESEILQNLKNVKMPGEIPYKKVPELASTFDVALIPFKIIDLTLATNPVKIFEYAAMGLPVVATMLPELVDLPEHVVSQVETPEAAAEEIRRMLTSSNEVAVDLRKKWASKQTWNHRAEAFEEVLANRPLVSVVVLAYNKLELTKACLVALEQSTTWPHEVIVVDNASTDGTSSFLSGWHSKGLRHIAVISDTNLGFAGGNNLGISRASGDVLVMLNNDTEPLNGWLTPLMRSLEDQSVGIVGPATNNSGNESRIHVDEKNLRKSVAGFHTQLPPRFLESNSLAFFCVALRRDVVSQVGLLDTAYGIGMFEDDDYCNRVRSLNLKVGINFQSFVFHQMSASFNELGSYKEELFTRNKAIYESKWGTWRPHRHLDPLPNTSPSVSVGSRLELKEVQSVLSERFVKLEKEFHRDASSRRSVEAERVRIIQDLQTQLSELSSRFDELIETAAVNQRRANDAEHQLASAEHQLASARHQIMALRMSRSFRIGRFVLLPVRALRRVARR